ncbi:MAG: transporter [Coraliomargarita sp.]|nr:transporter [Coraliomargarita sp.]
MKQRITSTILSIAALPAAYADPVFDCCPSETHHGRPDSHAPISIMGDHTHEKGGWMLSYRFMRMKMDGMVNGTNSASSQEVFDANYAVTPESMTMDMHMFGFMYAPTDKLTLMVMGNYLDTEMDHAVDPAVAGMINNGESGFTTESSGWGDTKVSALYNFYEKDNRKAHIGLGLNLPTGSIKEEDHTPAMGGRQRQQLPAPMQLGSGTYDLLPSITFRQQFDRWSYGAQASGIVRLEDENDNDYRLGHVFEMTGWIGRTVTDWVSINGGLSYEYTGELDGDQKDVNQMAPGMRRSVTTAFEDNYGGERVDLIGGLNVIIPKGWLKGHRIAADVRVPVWQDLNGYQLETDYVLTLGWQKAW